MNDLFLNDKYLRVLVKGDRMDHSVFFPGDSGLASLDLMDWTPNLLGCNKMELECL